MMLTQMMTQFEQKDLTLLHDFLTSAHDLMRFLKKTFLYDNPLIFRFGITPHLFQFQSFLSFQATNWHQTEYDDYQ